MSEGEIKVKVVYAKAQMLEEKLNEALKAIPYVKIVGLDVVSFPGNVQYPDDWVMVILWLKK